MSKPSHSDRNHPTRTVGIGLTQAEVAAMLGISRGRVWQIEQRALAKLARDPVLQQYARDVLGVEPDRSER